MTTLILGVGLSGLAAWREIGPFEDLLMLQRFDQPFPTWWTMRPGAAAVLAGWVGGPLVRRVRGKHGSQLLDPAMGSLAAALALPKARVEERLVSWHHHDWNGDSFSRGAYSYVLSGGHQAWQTLARPLERTLYFAGEATAAHGFNATVEGAIAGPAGLPRDPRGVAATCYRPARRGSGRPCQAGEGNRTPRPDPSAR